jgi:RNA polymerase sigma-70 factor (ECF subfamily)
LTPAPQHANYFFTAHAGDLRAIASKYTAREHALTAMEPDALVNEAWLRLAAFGTNDLKGSQHFMTLSGRAMKWILIDLARARRAAKRDVGPHSPSCGIGAHPFDYELKHALRQALTQLAASSPSQARVVALRCFGGYSERECAGILSVSTKTVQRRWRGALVRLRELLGLADIGCFS